MKKERRKRNEKVRRETTKNKKTERIHQVDYRYYRFTVREWLRYGSTAVFMGVFAVWICYRTWLAFPVGIFIGVFYIRQKRKTLAAQRRQTMELHFRNVLSSIHTAMLAGYALENAVKTAEKDLRELYGTQDLLVRELKDIIWQMDCQRPVENLFWELGLRTDIEAIRTFGEVLIISKRTGGNMQKVLGDSWQSLTEKIDTEQEIAGMIAGKRYEQGVMCLMPAGIVLYLQVAFRGFLDPLYGNLTGVVIMTVALAIYLVSYLWGRKIVTISV